MEEATIKQVLKDAYFKEENVKEVKTLIRVRESIVASEGSIITIGGLPKARKSTFMFALVAAILSGQEHFRFTAEEGSIVLADTEQTAYDFSRHLGSLKKMLDRKRIPKQLYSFLFRQYDIPTTKAAIEAAVIKALPKYLILDSVTDMVTNVNDFEEARNFVLWLKQISFKYNVCIIALVHLSKTNNFTLGALGSSLDRVSQSTLIVKKDKDTGESSIEPLYLRSDEDFRPVAIRYNKDEGMYEEAEFVHKQQQNKFSMNNWGEVQHKMMISRIFADQNEMTYKALVEMIRNVYGIGDTNTRRTAIPFLMTSNYISCKDGIYTRK